MGAQPHGRDVHALRAADAARAGGLLARHLAQGDHRAQPGRVHVGADVVMGAAPAEGAPRKRPAAVAARDSRDTRLEQRAGRGHALLVMHPGLMNEGVEIMPEL